jgi:hypothetical protein
MTEKLYTGNMNKKNAVLGLVFITSLLLGSLGCSTAVDTTAVLPGGMFVFVTETGSGEPVVATIEASSGSDFVNVQTDRDGKAFIPLTMKEWDLTVLDSTGQVLVCDKQTISVETNTVVSVTINCD